MWDKAVAFIRRDYQTQISYRLDFVLRLFKVLISVSVFYFISQIIGTAVNPYLNEADYFHFALMGIAFVPFMTISTNSLSEAIHEYQHTGTLEVLFLSPTPIYPLLIMSTLWRYCWAFAESFIFLFVATFIYQANLSWSNILTASFVVALTIFANAGIGLINAGFVLVTKRTSPVARLLGLVTNLLAGVYYPTEVLPDWLRIFSYLLPATYSFEALRKTMLQGANLWEVMPQLIPLIGFIVILLPIGLISFQYAVRWAKIDGSLSQY